MTQIRNEYNTGVSARHRFRFHLFFFLSHSLINIAVLFPYHSPHHAPVNTTRSREAEHGVHELIVVDLHPAVAVRVELLERLGDLLDHDARAHEAVERDPRGGRAVACARAGALVDVYPERGDRSAVAQNTQGDRDG